MKWSKSIPFSRPLRDVCLLRQAPAQDWEAHLQEREQAAYERGRREGELAQRDQAGRQQDESTARLNELLNSLRQTVPQVIHDTESALVDLALEAAQKLVGNLPISSEMIEAVVREALRQTEDTAGVTVQLHPDDLALLRKHQSSLLNGLPENGPLRFAGSLEVTRGGCVLQTRLGQIDARRETKMEQLRQTLAV